MIKVNRRFIISTAGFFCFSLFFGGRLPFYIFYSMLAMFLISYTYIRILLSAFDIEVNCSEKLLDAGASANVLIKLKFNLPLPVPYVEVRSDVFTVGKWGYTGMIRNTSWDENIWIDNDICFYQRGIHSLDSVSVKVTDLFHLTSFEKRINTGISIKVYPRIYKIKPLSTGGIDIYLEKTDIKSRNEDQYTIKDVRKYKEGDSLKKIHWKLSVKHDDLYVKNLDTISGEEIVLFIDMNQKNYSYDDKGIVEESIVDFSASIINKIISMNLNANVFLNTSPGKRFELGDKSAFDKFMEYLVSQKSNGNLEMFQYIYENSSRLHRLNRIAVVTSELDGRLADTLLRMSSSGYDLSVFFCISNPAQSDYSSLLKASQIECCYFRDYTECQGQVGL